MIFAPPYSPGDLRWVGNEEGHAGTTQWSTYPTGVDEDPASLNVGIEGADSWMPAETDVSIRPGWYWEQATDGRVKSVNELLDVYYSSVGATPTCCSIFRSMIADWCPTVMPSASVKRSRF